MLAAASTGLREIWRQIFRQISRPQVTLTLPVAARPQGWVPGAIPGTFEPSPESQQVLLDELTENILRRLPEEMDCRQRGRRVIAKLRDLVGDLPRASRSSKPLAGAGAAAKNGECPARRGYSRSSRKGTSRLRERHPWLSLRNRAGRTVTAEKCPARSPQRQTRRVSCVSTLSSDLAQKECRSEGLGAFLDGSRSGRSRRPLLEAQRRCCVPE